MRQSSHAPEAAEAQRGGIRRSARTLLFLKFFGLGRRLLPLARMQPPPPPPLAKPAKPHAPHVRGGPPPPPPSGMPTGPSRCAASHLTRSSEEIRAAQLGSRGNCGNVADLYCTHCATQWKFEPSSAKPIDVLKFDRHFADALGFSCSEPGADGVMFVGWSDGGTVVLKGALAGVRHSRETYTTAFSKRHHHGRRLRLRTRPIVQYVRTRIEQTSDAALRIEMPFPSMQLCRYSIEPRWEVRHTR